MDNMAETGQDRLRQEMRRTHEDCVATQVSCRERNERAAAMRVRLAVMRDKLDAMRARIDALPQIP